MRSRREMPRALFTAEPLSYGEEICSIARYCRRGDDIVCGATRRLRGRRWQEMRDGLIISSRIATVTGRHPRRPIALYTSMLAAARRGAPGRLY